MSGLADRASELSTLADDVDVARRYVDAYNKRDLDAMLAVMDEDVVSYPAPLYGHRPHFGHSGVRAWWATMASNDAPEVVVSEVRQLGSGRVAVLGEIRSPGGRRLSPWAVIVVVRNGLIIESRSYLSDEALLSELGLLEQREEP